MLIRKLFTFEGAHVVRNCYTERCSFTSHGHSYKIEILVSSPTLDNAGMVLDFNLFKGPIKSFIDAFDHTYTFWDKEDPEYVDFIKKYNKRWIELPVSPSAEMFSLVLYAVINRILENTIFNNNEGEVKLESVRVHETETGYAECFNEDYENLWLNKDHSIAMIDFSDNIKKEICDMWDQLLRGEPFITKKPEQQIK